MVLLVKLEFDYVVREGSHATYCISGKHVDSQHIIGKYTVVDSKTPDKRGKHNSIVEHCVAIDAENSPLYAYCHQYSDSFCCHADDDRDYIVAIYNSETTACDEMYHRGVDRKTAGGWEHNYVKRLELRKGDIVETGHYGFCIKNITKNNREYKFRLLYRDGEDAPWPFESAAASKRRVALCEALENSTHIDDGDQREALLSLFEAEYRDRGREHVSRLLDYLDGLLSDDEYVETFRETSQRDHYLNSV